MRGGQNNRVPVLAAPTLLGVAYAFWQDLTAPFTIALMIGQARIVKLQSPGRVLAVVSCCGGPMDLSILEVSACCNCLAPSDADGQCWL